MKISNLSAESPKQKEKNMNLLNSTRISAKLGSKEIIFETGRLARQAAGAVWVQCEETVCFATVCETPLETPKDFFPLTVEYSEKMYAAGRIPGNYFRREIGRPSENETLVSRLIDRPIRPLFPKGYGNEVQVLAQVLSADGQNMPDVFCITAASAALCISHIPFDGPIAGARLGRINGEFVINPTKTEQEQSDLDLVFAASETAVVMVEGEAKFVPEDIIIAALEWGHKAIQPLIEVQKEFIKMVGKAKVDFIPKEDDVTLYNHVEKLALAAGMENALRVTDKLERKDARKAVKTTVKTQMLEDEKYGEDEKALKEIGDILDKLEKNIVRQRIKNEGTRIDNRDTKTVRPIEIESSVLPRTHGSVLFARGETKSLVVTTLGSSTDELRIDGINGDELKHFMLHYNFPPFSVGEVKPVRVSRREIGHGHLAERALKSILPKQEDFPFTIRIVSETLESNGSSSMAAVCGGCLSLMDAGVPIKTPIAGVAMGLIKEDDEYIVLTDILGDEDALGDMDFKIAGSAEGITAVQMDIKINGLPTDVMARAMTQAKEARLHILNTMVEALPAYRENLSVYAPQYEQITVNPDVIRMIIGPGGKNIKAITAATGASIDIDDSGIISLFAPTSEALAKTKEMILYYDQKADLGKNYNAKVIKILEIGAIVELLPNLEALVHISQLSLERIAKVEDVVKLGDVLEVKVIEVNGDKVRASRKVVLQEEQGIEWNPEETARPPRKDRPRDGRSGDRNRQDRPDRRPRRD